MGIFWKVGEEKWAFFGKWEGEMGLFELGEGD